MKLSKPGPTFSLVIAATGAREASRQNLPTGFQSVVATSFLPRRHIGHAGDGEQCGNETQ